LIEASRAAHAQPALYFPKTAWVWATAEKRGQARAEWEGSDFKTGERDYAPGYARLLARDLDFLDLQSAAHAHFVAAVELVSDVLDPRREMLSKA
jgi:exodeoxyribonuclease V gamma subunit